MHRPLLGSLLLSLPVALVLTAPMAQAQSSSGAQNSRLNGLFGIFRDEDENDDVRQVQMQQSSPLGQGRVESEALPPPGFAQPNGVQAPMPGNGQQMGHQFGDQQPQGLQQPQQQQGMNPVIARPPGSVGAQPPVADAPPQQGQGGTQNSVMSLPAEDQPEQGTPKELPAHLKKQLVDFQTKEPAGTIIVDTPNTYLYLVLGGGKALRYGVRVGREGFTWAGTERISRMREWPDWHPPAEMIERQPYLPRFMAGGDGNPMGARAMYLGNTLYRIHGTNQPSTIGQTVSSGCVGMLNEDVADLFSRVQVGTRVVVWPGKPPATVANAAPQAPMSTGSAPMAPQPASAAPAPAPVNPPVMSRPMQPAR